MKLFARAFVSWLPLACAITGLCLLVQLAVQQNYRQSLNDPQIQMAEDGAASLATGEAPAGIVPQSQFNIEESLAPWIAVYNASGTPLYSSGVVGTASAEPPLGVFESARAGLPLVVGHHLTTDIPVNENRVSWQLSSGSRQAIVVVWVPQTQQFVVAGRNMREVENREGQLNVVVLIAWALLIISTFVLNLFVQYWL